MTILELKEGILKDCENIINEYRMTEDLNNENLTENLKYALQFKENFETLDDESLKGLIVFYEKRIKELLFDECFVDYFFTFHTLNPQFSFEDCLYYGLKQYVVDDD